MARPPHSRGRRPRQTRVVSALVLAADHDPFDLRLLQELCESAGHRVVTAASSEDVLEQVARERPDVVLLDAELPDVHGRDLMEVLRADPELGSIAILLVTNEADVRSRRADPDGNADDYLTKPFRTVEVTQRVRNALRMRTAERDAARARATDPLDALTRAGSAEQLRIALEYEVTRAARYGHPLGCLVVRIENFPAIIAQSGLDAGEGLVVQLANGVRTCLRGVDQVFRSESGELTALLPETDPPGAGVVLERVLRESRDSWLKGLVVTPVADVRVGLCTFPGDQIASGAELHARARAGARAAGG